MDLKDPFGEISDKIFNKLSQSSEEILKCDSVEDKFSQAIKEDYGDIGDFTLLMQVDQNDRKDDKISVELREKGKIFFKQGNYPESLKYYNRAVKLAICSVDFDEEQNFPEFATALTNRSAVLSKFKMYKNVIEDLEVAVRSGYPKHLLYKAYQRLGVAYEGLGDQESAKHSYEQLIKVLDFSDIPNEKLTKMKMDAKHARGSLEEQNSVKQQVIGSLDLADRNENISALSGSVDIRQTEEKGRFAIAKRQIDVGEVVAKESAMISLLDPTKTKTHCQYCTCETISPLPCASCNFVGFCSRSCRREGLLVHQRMCKLSSFLSRLPATNSPRTTHILLTLSLVLKHPISFHSDVFNKWKSRSQTIKESRDFVAYYKLLNMVKHFDDLCLLKLFSIVLILLQICKDVGYITNTTSKEEETLMGKIFCHYYAAVLPNCHSIFELKSTAADPINTDSVGVAIFPDVATHINHSCDPNTFVIDTGGSQVTIASRIIKEGEEINHVYMGHFGDTDKEKRQKSLSEKYHFWCSCEACEKDYMNSKECLKITQTYVNTPKEYLKKDLSVDLLDNLDKENEALRTIVENALSKHKVDIALEATKERIRLACEHLKQPHILHIMGRCAIVKYMCYIYAIRSFQHKPKMLPCYY